MIHYGEDAKVGPAVKGWIFTHFSSASQSRLAHALKPIVDNWAFDDVNNGGFDNVRKAKVVDYQINGNVDDNCFTLTFPVGTQVSERTSNHKTRQYVQKATGLEPIGSGR